MGIERGQAQIEAVAAIGLLVAVAALGVKVAATVNATLVADAATHAGALAQSAGGDGEKAARRALPRRTRPDTAIRARAGAIRVRLPVALAVGDPKSIAVRSRAWSRLPGG